MKLKEHIVYGAAASAGLYPFYQWKTVFFFAASVLIDIDHYIDYLYFNRFKNWSVKTMFRYHHTMSEWRHKPHIHGLEAFHTAEFFLAVLLVAFFFRSTELFLIFFGMTFHILLDLIRMSFLSALHLRAHSFVQYWIKAQRMRRSGIDPEAIFRQAYGAASGSPEPELIHKTQADFSVEK